MVFSRISKNKSKALVAPSGQMVELALRQGNFKQAVELLLQDFEKTARRLDLCSRLHSSRRVQSLKSHSRKRLKALATRLLMAYYLRDNMPLEDLSKHLGRLLRRSRRLSSLRSRLNKKTLARVVQEVELEVLSKKQPQLLISRLENEEYYTRVNRQLRRHYQLQASENSLEILKDNIKKNRRQLQTLCAKIATLYEGLDDLKANEYRRQALIYSPDDLQQKLKAIPKLIKADRLPDVKDEETKVAILSLQIQVAMFSFHYDYCDFNFKVQYMHHLIAGLRKLKHYDKQQFQILHDYLSLAHYIYKQKSLSQLVVFRKR